MLLLLFISLTQAKSIPLQFVNSCSQAIWPAIGANADMAWRDDPLPSGCVLRPGANFRTTIGVPWAGRVWGKQFCAEDGTNCFIGDCGAPNCWRSSASFATLFELSADADTIWYDISLGTSTHQVL